MIIKKCKIKRIKIPKESKVKSIKLSHDQNSIIINFIQIL